MASSLCLLDARWRRPVFSVASRDYDWLDVFVGAMVRGEWRSFEQRLIAGLACLAEAASSQAWPSSAQLTAVSTAFRSEHDLLSRAETLAWLDRAHLSLEAWTDYLMRQMLVAAWAEKLGDLVARHDVAVTPEAFAAEGVCSGQFDRYAQTLAGRAAVAARWQASSRPASNPIELDRFQAPAGWLGVLEPCDLTARASTISALEAGFQAAVQDALTQERLAAQLALNPLEWTRVDLERVSFDRIEAAREAVWCIKEDGLSLTEIARRSRHAIHDTSTLLEHIEPAVRAAVLSGAADELIGPIAVGRRFELMTIVSKTPPDLGDTLVRQRAEEAVVEQLLSSAVLTHVRWAGRP